jgi:hypothetical protein
MTTEQAREEVEKKFVRGMLIRRITMEFKLRKVLSPAMTSETMWEVLRDCEEGGN